MDIKGLAENIDVEEDEYLELIELFLETTESNLNKLKSGVDASDNQQVIEASHTIKGSAANLGLEEIAEMAKGVELNARQSSLEGAAEAATLIKGHCGRIKEELKT